ncbi:insulinase family protein [bacterium]|nr:insulinase family protein [bacterium]
MVIAGDIDTAKTKALVEKWFSDVKAGDHKVNPVKADPVKVKGIVKKTVTDSVALPLRMQAWITPALYTQGDADMDVLAYILGGSKNSRLYKRLVYDMQIAQVITSNQSSSNLGSEFYIEYIPLPGHSLDEIQKVVTEEIVKIQNNPPSPEEIERAVNKIESNFYANVELCSEKADMLNNYYVHFGKADSFAADLGRYHKVTPQSVSECAKQYLDLENYVEITVVPEKGGPANE